MKHKPFNVKSHWWDTEYWQTLFANPPLSEFTSKTKAQADAIIARLAWEQEHNLDDDGNPINIYWSDRLVDLTFDNRCYTVPPEDPLSNEQVQFEAELPDWIEGQFYKVSYLRNPDCFDIQTFESQKEYELFIWQHCDLMDEYCKTIEVHNIGKETVKGGFITHYHYGEEGKDKIFYTITLNSFDELKVYHRSEGNHEIDSTTYFVWWSDENDVHHDLHPTFYV